jgi:hypothetical protein
MTQTNEKQIRKAITSIQNPYKFFLCEDESHHIDSIKEYLREISGLEVTIETKRDDDDKVFHIKHDKIPLEVYICDSVIQGGDFLIKQKNDFDAVISDFLFETEMRNELKSQLGGFLLVLLGSLNCQPGKKGIYRVITAAPSGMKENGYAYEEYNDAFYLSKVFEKAINIPFRVGKSERAWPANLEETVSELAKIRLEDATPESLRKLYMFFEMIVGAFARKSSQKNAIDIFERTFHNKLGDHFRVEFRTSPVECDKSFRDLFPDVARYYVSWNQGDYKEFKDVINRHYEVVKHIYLKNTSAKVKTLYDQTLNGDIKTQNGVTREGFLHFQESGKFDRFEINEIKAKASTIISKIEVMCEIPTLRSSLCAIYREIAGAEHAKLNEPYFVEKTRKIKKLVRFMPRNSEQVTYSTFHDFSMDSQNEGNHEYYTDTKLLETVLNLMISNAKDARGGGFEGIRIREEADVLYIGIKRKVGAFDEGLSSWLNGNEDLKKFISCYHLGEVYFQGVEDSTEKVVDLSIKQRTLIDNKGNFKKIFNTPGYLILCIYRT